MNLIEKLGLEKCKQIVENHATCYMPRIFKYWSESLNDYVFAEKYATASVEAIRTALADHDRTDHVTDIRNHISPNTRVSEAHVNEAFKLNRLG